MNLSRCNMTDYDMKWLSKNLKRNETLTEINLSYNNMSEKGANFIFKALKNNKNIEILDLNENVCFRKDGYKNFNEFFKNQKKIK